jgi:hypothetical protein
MVKAWITDLASWSMDERPSWFPLGQARWVGSPDPDLLGEGRGAATRMPQDGLGVGGPPFPCPGLKEGSAGQPGASAPEGTLRVPRQ